MEDVHICIYRPLALQHPEVNRRRRRLAALHLMLTVIGKDVLFIFSFAKSTKHFYHKVNFKKNMSNCTLELIMRVMLPAKQS